MDLFFIRHSNAVDRSDLPDLTRPLTQEGIDRAQRCARLLKNLGVKWDILLTSPLVRALETAHILQEAALAQRLEVYQPLIPGGNFSQFQEWLKEQSPKSTLALVGHQPDLGYWVEMLLYGEAHGRIDLKKCGVARIWWEPSQAELLWLLPPRVY